MERLRPRFNVAVAEMGAQDVWQQAELGICTVANSGAFVDEVLAKVIRRGGRRTAGSSSAASRRRKYERMQPRLPT